VPKTLIASLQDRVTYHREQLEKFEEALAAAQRDEKQRLKQKKPTATSKGTQSVLKRQQPPEFTKIDFIYNLIQQHAKKGIATSDITQLATTANVTGGTNFPYVILWKLKKEGSITARDGRYYPVEKK
jgi:sRNA-binding protein